jgi:hypothetical protein
MNFGRFLNLALAVFLTVATAVTPSVAPAAARALSSIGNADMQSTSGAMPCCPDGQNSKDCQDCPLLAVCALRTAQPGPSPIEALPLRYANRTAYSVLEEVPADGLKRPPPDHPPRNLS